MFDTMLVARKIREARISQNMTQMNLADTMEVSYQAVSNWERGNSMPDIAKLEQLGRVLHISLEELLGTDTSKTLERIINKEEDTNESVQEVLTYQEIEEVAPILPPADVEKLVEDTLEQQEEENLNLSAITGLAPFLDHQFLDSLVQKVPAGSLQEITGLAPFLSNETLNKLVLNADGDTDMSGITSLAPFLSHDTLDQLIEKIQPQGNLRQIAGLAPFLSHETLSRLVLNTDAAEDMSGIVSLAPFLGHSTLDKLLDSLPKNEYGHISGLAPFLSQETLQKIAKKLMTNDSLPT